MKTLAAQYVRMSTEHQQYSTENQADCIRDYARAKGIEIVANYSDEGKSGLKIGGRSGLQKLIEDVQSGRAAFNLILVYDVSRWGRFQDTDESAYYEYICRRAGICVEYCAEQFTNDGTPSATIIKSVKRAMAAEYSRELSNKVFRGQCRLIELGFRQGGPAGYGLRRQLVNESRQPKGVLSVGEHKSLQTDRVVLVPGPSEEVEVVRRIYEMFVEGSAEAEIARRLNDEGVPADCQRLWSRGSVRQILTNEKYIGNNVWNRSSTKLGGATVRNSPAAWVRANDVFSPVVERALFEQVAEKIAARARAFSDGELIEALARLFRSRGFLSGFIIDEADDMPSSATYASRFGSLVRAYSMVGYTPRQDYRYIEINRRIRDLHPHVISDVEQCFQSVGANYSIDAETGVYTVNREFRVSVVLVRCVQRAHGLRWTVRLSAQLASDLNLVVRMDRANERALDYYLLPGANGVRFPLDETNAFWIDAFRFDDLSILSEIAAREDLVEAA